jgi:RNA polymerase sigma-70 factor (ECF subfamily)
VIPEGRSRAPSSFEEEALPHLEAVYRFALRLSGSPDQAEDLLQDTFLRAYRAWDRYEPGTRAKSWLFTICRNVFLRQRERGQRHEDILKREAPRGEGGVPSVNPLWSSLDGVDPEGDFFAAILDEEVLRAMDRVPEDYRTAVVLSDVEGLSYGEIAEVTGVPVGTVKSRLFRGRRQLQRALYDYAVQSGVLPASSSRRG